MKNLNGIKRLLGVTLRFATALLVIFIGSNANADIVISNTAIVIDNKTIPASEVASIFMSNGVLNISVPGWSVARSAAPTPGAVVINFTGSSPSIETGQSITLIWSTTNATSCNASGSWTGTKATSGNVTVTPAAGTYTYILTCSGSSGTTASKSVPLTVSTPTPGPNPVPTPANCPTPSLSGSVVSWASVAGDSFPNPNGLDKVVNIGGGGYMAISFNLGDLRAAGSIGLVETTTASGSRLGAISECPGDFSVPKPCSQVWGVTEILRWATLVHPVFCKLENNKTYYLNFTFTDGRNANTATCSGPNCVIRIDSTFTVLQ